MTRQLNALLIAAAAAGAAALVQALLRRYAAARPVRQGAGASAGVDLLSEQEKALLLKELDAQL